MSLPFGKKLTGHLPGHLTGNLTGLTGFCPDHANNHLSKSCHHACLAVGALELEMGQPWFCVNEGCLGPILLSIARRLQATLQVTLQGTLQVTLQDAF